MPAKGYKKKNARDVRVILRLTDEEKQKLDTVCTEFDTNYSEFLRKQIDLRYDYIKPQIERKAAQTE